MFVVFCICCGGVCLVGGGWYYFVVGGGCLVVCVFCGGVLCFWKVVNSVRGRLFVILKLFVFIVCKEWKKYVSSKFILMDN